MGVVSQVERKDNEIRRDLATTQGIIGSLPELTTTVMQKKWKFGDSCE
jgi:hypothetical protein